jgi:hypothetical protein
MSSAPPRDPAEWTFQFAKQVRLFSNAVPRTTGNQEDVLKLIQSSGLVATAYLESLDGLSEDDRSVRIRECRKAARESGLWLRLLHVGDNVAVETERRRLVAESEELVRMFASMPAKKDSP